MKLVIASRLHLGRASSAPPDEQIQKVLENLGTMAASMMDQYDTSVVIAVDATPKIENYDYVQANQNVLDSMGKYSTSIEILPVTPWFKFVPALNALVLHAKSQLNADLIMFVSAEVNASASTISTLCEHITADKENEVIVVGAAMKGHDYQGPGKTVALTGRTTPWNTLCVWNLEKLSFIGFASISDLGKSAGVEECVAIALLQKIFPKSVAKLVKVEEISWEETFADEERRKWHEEKMKSKVERPAHQLNELGLSGTVLHC